MVEAETLQRLGSLEAGTPQLAENRFVAIPKVIDEDDDSAFPRTAVREAIVMTVIEVIGILCRTEGEPRRSDYKIVSLVAHGGDMPTSMGPYGAIYDGSNNRSLTERSAQDIAENRQMIIDGILPAGAGGYYYALDGDKIYHSLPGNASVEYFDAPIAATNFSLITPLFLSEAQKMPLADEFAPAVADGAAGRLMMRAGSMVAEGSAFLRVYVERLQNLGLTITPGDFPARKA